MQPKEVVVQNSNEKCVGDSNNENNIMLTSYGPSIAITLRY